MALASASNPDNEEAIEADVIVDIDVDVDVDVDVEAI